MGLALFRWVPLSPLLPPINHSVSRSRSLRHSICSLKHARQTLCSSYPLFFVLILAITPLYRHIRVLVALQIALEGDTALLMRGILSSIAAGTFTYVSYMELITEAFEDGLDRSADHKLG